MFGSNLRIHLFSKIYLLTGASVGVSNHLTSFVVRLFVVRLPVCSPSPPPNPLAPETCWTFQHRIPLPCLSTALPTLFSHRQGAENSPATPPAASLIT
jgi:hypothetical protein